MKPTFHHTACAVLMLALAVPAVVQGADPGKYIERGRYLVKVGSCNDCHTAGYPQSDGKIPEKEWLTGGQVGYLGPWGTTYPTNLRLSMNAMKEDDWIKMAQSLKARPPMPWFALQAFEKEDLRAIYRFVRHLGPAGKPAPAWVPPDRTPAGPLIRFPAPAH
ncbi:MAG: cytochrome C [Lysobacteraceae bacterium]|nr:MAG: cytochrome C [Xanthomonadaceae bacterium]